MKLKRFNHIKENNDFDLNYKLSVNEFNIDVNPNYEHQNIVKKFLIDNYEKRNIKSTKFKISLIKAAINENFNEFNELEESYAEDNGDIVAIRTIDSLARELSININDLENRPYIETLKRLYDGLQERFIKNK